MAASTKPLLVLCLAMALLFNEITSRPSTPGNDEGPASELHCSSSLRSELDELKSRITSLESIIDERTQELRSKEESIRNMEMMIREKSDTMALLQSEVDFLQPISFKKHKSKGQEQAYELEKQMFRLKKEIDMQNKRKFELENRADVAEKKVIELSSKLEKLQKVNDEQKKRIHDTEYSLKAEQLLNVELEAASTTKKLVEIHGEGLPHWFAVHLSQIQLYMVTQWNENMAALDATVRKAMEKRDQVKKWSEPHIEMLNSRWIPTIKDIWLTFTTYLEPRVQSLAIKSIEVYHVSKESLTPYVIKAFNIADDYIRVARKHADPYISQVVTVTKPHLDKAHVVLEPYTRKIDHAYKKFVKSATTYHQQAQEVLKNNDLTRPVATMELAWFAATALLGLPIIFIIKLFSAISSPKPMRYNHKLHVTNAQRRAKRRHPY